MTNINFIVALYFLFSLKCRLVSPSHPLKVRKERAQTELALQRERERSITAEATITEQAAEILRLQQQLVAQAARYDTDTTALQQALQQSQAREQYLTELSDEAYELMTMYGVRKV